MVLIQGRVNNIVCLEPRIFIGQGIESHISGKEK